jgi:small ligand-binding sensory domain FIST
VIDENRPEYDIGDFLMRGLLGADEATGALVLATACGSLAGFLEPKRSGAQERDHAHAH